MGFIYNTFEKRRGCVRRGEEEHAEGRGDGGGHRGVGRLQISTGGVA